MLFLHELKQLLILVKHSASASSIRFYQTGTTHTIHHFPIELFANGGISSKHLN